MIFTEFDQHCMQQALLMAQQAASLDEVPVGAVLAVDQQIIATGFNKPISSCDPTAHAEIVAMREAALKLGNYRLVNSTLYVTLEPCPMCAGAMVHARIQRLVYGAADPKAGATNHKVQCDSGLLAEPCAELLRTFFKERR